MDCFEHDFFDHDHEQYCNYPEIAKSFKSLLFDEEDHNCDSSSSSSLPSLTSAVSEQHSQPNLKYFGEQPPSLTNFLKLSLSSEESSTTVSLEMWLFISYIIISG